LSVCDEGLARLPVRASKMRAFHSGMGPTDPDARLGRDCPASGDTWRAAPFLPLEGVRMLISSGENAAVMGRGHLGWTLQSHSFKEQGRGRAKWWAPPALRQATRDAGGDAVQIAEDSGFENVTARAGGLPIRRCSVRSRHDD